MEISFTLYLGGVLFLAQIGKVYSFPTCNIICAYRRANEKKIINHVLQCFVGRFSHTIHMRILRRIVLMNHDVVIREIMKQSVDKVAPLITY